MVQIASQTAINKIAQFATVVLALTGESQRAGAWLAGGTARRQLATLPAVK
jgi:hypothetical protein